MIILWANYCWWYPVVIQLWWIWYIETSTVCVCVFRCNNCWYSHLLEAILIILLMNLQPVAQQFKHFSSRCVMVEERYPLHETRCTRYMADHGQSCHYDYQCVLISNLIMCLKLLPSWYLTVCPWKVTGPRKGSSFNHQFSGAFTVKLRGCTILFRLSISRVSQLAVSWWFGGLDSDRIPFVKRDQLLHRGKKPDSNPKAPGAPNHQVSSLLSIPNCFYLTTSHLILCMHSRFDWLPATWCAIQRTLAGPLWWWWLHG